MKVDKYGLVGGVETVTDSQRASLEEHQKALSDILDRMHSQFDAINSDPGLNHFGKQQRRTKVIESARGEVAKANDMHAKPFLRELERAKTAIPSEISYPKRSRPEMKMDDPDPDGARLRYAIQDMSDRLARDAREAEIRAALRQLDPVEIPSVIQGAAEAQDLETLMAAKNAPHIMRLADPETIADATSRYLHKRYASEFAGVKNAEESYDHFVHNASVAEKTVRGGPDPIAEQAGK